MRIDIYRKKAGRTMANLGLKLDDSIHMVLGMNTECSELLSALKQPEIDMVNVKEEVGDLMWYVANYAELHKLFINLTDQAIVVNAVTAKDYWEEIYMVVGELQDLDKKLLAYKRKYDLNIQMGLFKKLGFFIYKFCKIQNFDLEQIMQTNIDKLVARYPDKFDEDRANNRDLETERKILEK